MVGPFCLASLLDSSDKLVISPVWRDPVQFENIPSKPSYCEVYQTWNLLCMRIHKGEVTLKGTAFWASGEMGFG